MPGRGVITQFIHSSAGKKTKAQASGGSAAVLILVIAALIVIYILFLPPKDRQELLGENVTDEDGSGSINASNVLLLEHPGRLDVLAKKEIEHTLPSVNLFTKTESSVLESRRSLYTKNAWFDRTDSNITFDLKDVSNSKNIQLVFNAKQYSGRLMLKLNGYEVFNEEIATPSVPPVSLPSRLLQESNVIEVSVSSVGWRFWRTNEYMLENLQISADITDVSTRQAQEVFQVGSTEKNNLDRVFVKFFAECDTKTAGVLEVILNNNRVFSSVPDCGTARTLEISPHYLLSNENTLIFRADRGQFLIDNILVKSELKELIPPTYYFELNDSEYQSVIDKSRDVKLYLDFPDDVSTKRAEIVSNTHVRGMDTEESSYSVVISQFVKQGNNVILIRPKETLDVVNLKVMLEKR